MRRWCALPSEQYATALARRLLQAAPMRVLVVIDDPLLTELIVETLAERGHVASAVAEPAQAVRLLELSRVDVVIVDLDIRGAVCASVPTAMRALAPGARVVALLPCGGAGATVLPDTDAAFEKPVRLRQLLAFVDGARR